MKAIEHISQNVRNTNLEKIFSHKDIDKILFLGKKPLYKAYPFKLFKKLHNISVTYTVSMYDTYNDLDGMLSNAISKVGTLFVNPDVTKLDIILLDALFSEFSIGVSYWQQYILQQMEEYTKTPVSILNWGAIQTVNGFLGTNLSYEQKIWIFTCQRNDDKKKMKFAEDLRESVLPFLNYEMWHKLKHRKEEVRENATYDKQRHEMITGSFKTQEEELDIII